MPNTSTTPPRDHDTALKDFLRKTSGDCLSDAALSEIARRLLVFFRQPDPQIVRSATAPSDKTKLWLPVDAETGAPNGVLQGYNTTTGTWQDVSSIGECISDAEGQALEVDEEGCLLVPKGKLPGYCEAIEESVDADGSNEAELDVVYSGFEDTNAEISVNFKTDPGANARWCVEDRSVNGCTIHFFGITGTLDLIVYARRSS